MKTDKRNDNVSGHASLLVEHETDKHTIKHIDQQTQTHNRQIEVILTSLIKMTDDAIETKAILEKQETRLEKLIEDTQKDKIRLIEIMGIFVAFITFASGEIQLLKVIDIQTAWQLTLIWAGGILLFVLTLIQIAEYWIRGSQNFNVVKNKTIIAIFAFLTIGIFLGCLLKI